MTKQMTQNMQLPKTENQEEIYNQKRPIHYNDDKSYLWPMN